MKKEIITMYAIKVIWLEGDEEYLKEGGRRRSFANRERAEEMRSFMLEGMSEEVQSINVVPLPREE